VIEPTSKTCIAHLLKHSIARDYMAKLQRHHLYRTSRECNGCAGHQIHCGARDAGTTARGTQHASAHVKGMLGGSGAHECGAQQRLVTAARLHQRHNNAMPPQPCHFAPLQLRAFSSSHIQHSPASSSRTAPSCRRRVCRTASARRGARRVARRWPASRCSPVLLHLHGKQHS
jgi:hypothetical protein